jgi:prophage regulatory protein
MRVLNTEEVCDRTKYSRVHIWRLEKRNLFPKRLHLGDRRVAWVEAEVDEWLLQRVAERDA